MLVESSSLGFATSHAATAAREVEDRLQIRFSPPAAPGAASSSPAESAESPDSVDITDAKALIARWIFEYFTGRRAPLIRALNSASRATPRATARAAADNPQPQAPAAPSWGISYTHRETRSEAEAVSFAAEGSVKLWSGDEIRFAVRLDMRREHTETATLSVRAGNMTDPIVVNLDGAGVRLTGDRQAFDLDNDGADELIANLAAGSAWLARDLNGNGLVDNGSELFGPATGSGFAELAALDRDGNRWIDQGDAAFAELGLWRDGKLTSLAEAGIGALSVASASTPFALKEGSDALGQVRQTGVYLREDGGAGALQQIDLTV